jgi:hypothetical protein
MACDCMEVVDERLAHRNTILTRTITLTQNMEEFPTIATEQIDKRRGKPKAIGMIPSYCPFCGVKYEREG